MERPESMGEDDRSSEGPLAKVTIQEIKGISVVAKTESPTELPFLPSSCRGEVHENPIPRVQCLTAAVAFSGSAKDMQVASNCVCSKTGNVVVESQPATLPRSFRQDKHTGSAYPIVAEWSESDGSVVPPDGSSRSFSSRGSLNPHVTIRLPSKDPNVPAVSLAKLNRDCNVIHEEDEPPSLGASDESSTASDFAHELDQIQEDSSMVWSAASDVMPEIMELNVSLIAQPEEAGAYSSPETIQVGIAYVCFFGNDAGSTILDLPIKKHPKALQATSVTPLVLLEEDALLRVRVDIVNSEHGPKPVLGEDLHAEFLLPNDGGLDPILQKLCEAQDNHRTLRRKSAELRANERSGPRVVPPRKSFSCLTVGLVEAWSSLSDAVTKCEDGTRGLYHANSMTSTIMTAESLDI